MRRLLPMSLIVLTACTHQEEASVLADPGPARTGEVGDTFTFDGSASAAERWSWRLVELPEGSALGEADLHDAQTAWPWFVADAEGLFVLELTACDTLGACGSSEALAMVGSEALATWSMAHKPDLKAVGKGLGNGAYMPNKAPVASATMLRMRTGNGTILLNGSGSYDPEGKALRYKWSFVALPADSALDDSDLTGASTAYAGFVPDAPGDYEIQLMVSDGLRRGSTTLSMASDTDPDD